MFLFRFEGLFLFRFVERRFSALLLNAPPRSTRRAPSSFGPATPS
jgi:hypothetical protein